MRGNYLRLVTLGRLALLASDGSEEPLTKRRRQLAVLAVLALTSRPISRDVLVDMFWGEEEEDRARHSLSNTLSSLRRVLGPEAIATRHADVALAPAAHLHVDALELAAACEGGDHMRAVALYEGQFLDGVYVPGSARFEQWATRERARLERLFLHACEKTCSALAREGAWERCAAPARRWLDVIPPSRAAALMLVDSIAAPRTPEALREALDEYDRLVIRLQREYDSPPDPRVTEHAAELRAALAAALVHSPSVVAGALPASIAFAETTGGLMLGDPGVPSGAATPPARDDVHAAPSGHRTARRYRTVRSPFRMRRTADRQVRSGGSSSSTGRLLAGVGALVALVATVTYTGYRARQSGVAAVPTARPVVAVTQVDNVRNDTSIAWLQDGLRQMLASDLSRSSAVDVVPPAQLRDALARAGVPADAPASGVVLLDAARRLGATFTVRAGLTHGDGRYVADVTVRKLATGALVRLYTVAGTDIMGVADRIAATALDAVGASSTVPRFADVETSSPLAYQHYIRGMQALAEGRTPDDRDELDAAIALDSGFLRALRARRDLASDEGDYARATRLDALVQRSLARAPLRDRLGEEIWRALHVGESDRSDALARQLVAMYPGDPRAYATLAQVLGAHGEWREARTVLERELALDSLAIEAGRGPCAPCVAYAGLTWADASAGDFARGEQTARRWVRLQPDLPNAWVTLAAALEMNGKPDEAVASARRAADLTPNAEVQLVAGRALLSARHFTSVDSLIAAWRTGGDVAYRTAAADLATMLARERGQFRRAARTITPLLEGVLPTDGMQLVHADNVARAGDPGGAQRELERAAHSAGRGSPMSLAGDSARAFVWPHALAADLLAASGADTLRLRALADTIERAGQRSYYGRDWRLFHHVRGLIAARAGRWSEAEREFREARWGALGWSRTLAELARAQMALGRPADAIATLRLAHAAPLDAMGRYLPHSEVDWRMALAFRAAGMPDSARVYAGYVRAAWRDADPQVRARLASLPR